MRVYKKKTIRRMKWYGVILVLSGIPLGIGMGRSLEEGRIFLLEESQIYAQKLYLPLFSYQKEQESEREEIFRLPLHVWMPLAGYLEDQTEKRGKEEPAEVLEDEETIAWILQCQANDEHAVDEEGKLVGAEPETQESAVEQPVPGMDLSIERLRDFEYLTSNLYTIDSSTMIGPEQLNVDDLLNRSMKIDQSTGGPKILIFHTHSQEEFADSIPGDPSTSIVGIGEYLTQLLNADGIETLHDSGVYDIINGKLALDVGKIFFDEKDIVAYTTLGIGRLIYQLPLPLCKMFIKEIFEAKSPDDFDEETLTTINKFFENSLNVSETSRQLYIHRNTLVYRLDKLQKSTGLDLRVFEDAITFKIALMVVKYMKYMETLEY